MASLDILCSNSLNLKNKVTKIERKIFCGPSKILKNISRPINIRLKYFMILVKTVQPTPYPFSPLLHTYCMVPNVTKSWNIRWTSFSCMTRKNLTEYSKNECLRWITSQRLVWYFNDSVRITYLKCKEILKAILLKVFFKKSFSFSFLKLTTKIDVDG